MVVSRIFPSSPRRGGRDLNKISRSLLYGADGVVIKFDKILLSLDTTPSARAKDALRPDLNRAATPASERRGKIRYSTIWATAPKARGLDSSFQPRRGVRLCESIFRP